MSEISDDDNSVQFSAANAIFFDKRGFQSHSNADFGALVTRKFASGSGRAPVLPNSENQQFRAQSMAGQKGHELVIDDDFVEDYSSGPSDLDDDAYKVEHMLRTIPIAEPNNNAHWSQVANNSSYEGGLRQEEYRETEKKSHSSQVGHSYSVKSSKVDLADTTASSVKSAIISGGREVDEKIVFSESLRRFGEVSRVNTQVPPVNEATVNNSNNSQMMMKKKIRRDIISAYKKCGIKVTANLDLEQFSALLACVGVSIGQAGQLLRAAYQVAASYSSTYISHNSPDNESEVIATVGIEALMRFLFLVFGLLQADDRDSLAVINDVRKYRFANKSPRKPETVTIDLGRFCKPEAGQLKSAMSSAYRKDGIGRNNPVTSEAVFDRLYSEPKTKINKFKPGDLRTSEQKVIEEHCTFQPKITAGCPFLSERALREGLVPETSREVHSKVASFNGDEDHMYSSNQSSRSQSGTYINKSSGESARSKKSTVAISPFYYFRQNSNSVPVEQPIAIQDESFEEEVIEEVAGDSSSSATSLGGLFIPGFGLVRGPPASAGIPLFYFNPLGPPSFELGSYLMSKQVEVDPLVDEESIDEDDSSNAANSAPPLPSWAFGPGGDPQRNVSASKEPKLVIPKVAQPIEKKEATGWQRVLEEMAAKRGNMKMKKVEVEVKKPVGKLKKGSKKKEGFSDIIDELSHRLARMRGDIVDDDEEEETPAAPAPAPVQKAKTSSSTSSSTKESSDSVLRPATQRPANIPNPPQLDPMSPYFASLGGAAASTRPAISEKINGTVDGKIAMPKPVSGVPSPPPLPSQWPPTAPFVVPKRRSSKKSRRRSSRRRSSSFGKQTSVVTSATKLLPGYYMPSITGVVVPLGEVIPAGVTTVDLCKELSQPAVRKVVRKERKVRTNPNRMSNGDPKSLGTTPFTGLQNVRQFVPNTDRQYSQSASQHSPIATDIDPSKVGGSLCSHDAESVKLKRKTVRDLPLPTNFHGTIQRLQACQKLREEKNQRERDLELRSYSQATKCTSRQDKIVPVGFESNVQRRIESKSHSFRKPSERSTIDHLPQTAHVPPVTPNAKMVGFDDVSSSYFLSTLRDPGKSLMDDRNQSMSRPAQMVYNSSTSVSLSNNLKGHGPIFYNDQIVARRSGEREARKHQEQAERTAKMDQERQQKDRLHQQAIHSAVVSGAFDPMQQQHPHDKIISRLKAVPGVAAVDLSAIATARKTYECAHAVASGNVLTPGAFPHNEDFSSGVVNRQDITDKYIPIHVDSWAFSKA